MSLVHQADCKSHSWEENLQICSRLRPFQCPRDHRELALFLLTQQPAFGGGGGSKHAFLLLWGDFAQANRCENVAFQTTKGRGCDLLSALGHQGYNTRAHQLQGGDTANFDLSSSAPARQRGCCRQCIPAWCSSVAPKAFTVTLEAESPFKPMREKAGLRQVLCLAFSWKLWQWVSSYVGS